MQCPKLVVVFALILIPDPVPASRADTVKAWARTLSNELWRLSEGLTKSNQIRTKYKQMNASVKKKDGQQILQSALESVSTMLTRKINAVRCIHATAEQLARDFNYTDSKHLKDFEYCSAKYSKFSFEDGHNSSDDEFPTFAKDNVHYTPVALEKDSHFYDISITSNTSCVQVPTNIYYEERDAFNAILWSRGLDEVFKKNYNADPSLAWQYFGSSRGILRFYPGMPWNTRETDTYDCRVKSWYIEAATCSKDVIILFDVSGSMTGFKNYVARRTLDSLLDTLSNNDYVNVYAFKNETMEVVDCFVDLVQATLENVKTLKEALKPDENNRHKIPLEGFAELPEAYRRAFETLRMRREVKKCDVSSKQGCNQMVMLITDYVPGNLSEVFDEYNREIVDGQVYTPVRVFTYLIGKEVTNVEEIKWMACHNRGYYVHIHSVEEVQQQVLKYINVIARPMILDGSSPPPTWTHANIDATRTKSWGVSNDVFKPDEDKLVTSVAMPAFDYYFNKDSNDSMLLGVAGTDVPIDSIAKLAQPSQLGVNGYSFIVSNNGYLLLHPLLITSINGELQTNYNSVDFVEVEQLDDGKGSRDLGDNITRLREKLVSGVEDKEEDLPVLFHYDNMRRLSRVRHDYFFKNLEGTPFSMGISLPKGYGDTELLLKDNPLEAKQGQDLIGINVTDYFRSSYRVHPDWVYCKFHYLEGHESDNAEIEMFRFLANISRSLIDISKVQYNVSTQAHLPFDVSIHCGEAMEELGKDDYYCNEDLVKQLVFDAKLSTPFFKEWIASDDERDLAEKYNVTVRFIATSSGLTRWHYIQDDDKNEKVDVHGYRTKEYNGSVFGDQYYNAIEETWYKAAVLQHMISRESVVVATPLPVLDEIINHPPVRNEDGDINMTASYAIFYKDGDSETPASVVGFQFSYRSFFNRFMDLIRPSNGKPNAEDLQCDDRFVCYIVDSSGYVVLSSSVISDVGKFFGTLQLGVLESFLNKDIFDYVEVFNYQALCPVDILKGPNSGWSLVTPLTMVKKFMQWIILEALIMLSDVTYNMYHYSDGFTIVDDTYSTDLKDSKSTEERYAYNEPITTELPLDDNTTSSPDEEMESKTFSCDHRITLFILNQMYFLEDLSLSPVVFQDEHTDCVPAYWAAYMTKTNLMLVVVQTDGWSRADHCLPQPNTKPEPTRPSTTSREPCHKLDLGNLTRRPLEGCYTYDEKESNITQCGRGSTLEADLSSFFATTFIWFTLRLLS